MPVRRFATILVVPVLALALAGCQPGAPSSPSTGTTPDPGGSASPTVPASDRPTTAPTLPPATPVACAPGPLTVAQFLAADGRCYLETEVQVAGWSDGRRQADGPADDYRLNHLIRDGVPFEPGESGMPPSIFVDESAIVRPIGPQASWSWVTATVRRSSPQERVCYRPPFADVNSAPICRDHLIASAVVDSDPPASALAGCAKAFEADPIWIDTLFVYPAACFGSRQIRIHGWLDVMSIIAGWEQAWGMKPDWLWRPIGPWTVLRSYANGASGHLRLFVDPASGAKATPTDRWVVVTGRFAAPVAATCRFLYYDWYNPETDAAKPDDAWARAICASQFVVTRIVNAP